MYTINSQAQDENSNILRIWQLFKILNSPTCGGSAFMVILILYVPTFYWRRYQCFPAYKKNLSIVPFCTQASFIIPKLHFHGGDHRKGGKDNIILIRQRRHFLANPCAAFLRWKTHMGLWAGRPIKFKDFATLKFQAITAVRRSAFLLVVKTPRSFTFARWFRG